MTQILAMRWPSLACAFLVLQIYSGHASAQSTAGGFSSVVTIGGSVKQEANGNNNTQVINAGGMNASNTGSFNATVSVGGITQTNSGSGGVQTLNAGSMSNSSAGSFTANVNAGKLEQTGKGGERQEMDIGSVTNSTVSGAVNTTVNVRQGVKQVGEGEIAIGAVKNSNIGSFNNSITVNRVEGNNVRIGSVVGGSVYDNKGRFLNPDHSPTNSSNANANNSNSLQLPKFGESSTIVTKGSFSESLAPAQIRESNPFAEQANNLVSSSLVKGLGVVTGVNETVKEVAAKPLSVALNSSSTYKLLNGTKIARAGEILGDVSTAMDLIGTSVVLSNMWTDAANGTFTSANVSDLAANLVGYTPAKFVTLGASAAELAVQISGGGSFSGGVSANLNLIQHEISSFAGAMDKISSDLLLGKISESEAEKRMNAEKKNSWVVLDTLTSGSADFGEALALALTGNMATAAKVQSFASELATALNAVSINDIKYVAAAKAIAGN